MDLYHKVIERGILFELENEFVKSILDEKYSPILIEIPNCPVEHLSTEHGEPDIKDYVADILEYGAEECEQTNFRLNTVIPEVKLKTIAVESSL